MAYASAGTRRSARAASSRDPCRRIPRSQEFPRESSGSDERPGTTRRPACRLSCAEHWHPEADMRQVVYAPATDRLVYLDEKATPEFWDERWRAEGRAGTSRQSNEIVRVTRRYLPIGARVLEGGCGRADKVKALAEAGFEAIGLDFAEESVRTARLEYPGLDIRIGDVRSLPFPAENFDGYWSLGVIEHFWSGYDGILAEAHRVVRPGGRLFLDGAMVFPVSQAQGTEGWLSALPLRDRAHRFLPVCTWAAGVTAALSGTALACCAGAASRQRYRC